MKSIGTIALILFSTILSLLLVEVGFRAYLFSADPERFESNAEVPEFYGVYDRSLWEYDADFGYRYPPERLVNLTSISNGVVAGCSLLDYINENGNIGISGQKHANPDYTIAVFGDSWTAFIIEGKTWPIFLQDTLEARTGKKINVINYGRDGYSVVQMFDLAQVKIPESKPDLALFAFITDDIDRDRFWRTEVEIDGEARVLTTTERNPEPSLERSTDTFLLHSDATREWCLQTEGRRDAVVEAIEDKYLDLLAHANSADGPPPDLFTIEHSYLYNRFVHRDPTYFARQQFRPSQNPRLKQWSYRDIPGFAEAMASVNATGVPWRLVHLAFYPEVKAQKEYELSTQRAELLASLEAMAGHQAFRTLDYVELPVDRPERMNVTPTNFHPSLWGMEFYGNAVAEMIIQNGLLE